MSSKGMPAHLRSILVFAGFSLLSVLALRQIMFSPGTVGHHWDWSIPPSAPYFDRMLNQSMHLWSAQFLGFPFNYAISVLPTFAALGVLGAFGLTGGILSKALLLVVVSISGFGMYHLSLELMRYRLPAVSDRTPPFPLHAASLVAGYFYGFSPFLFNEIVGGAYTQFLSYALAPLAILSFLHCCSDPSSWKRAGFAALFLSALSMSLQYLVLVLILFSVIASITKAKGWAAFTRILSIWTPLNIYWILPLTFSFGSVQTQLASQNSSQSIIQNLTLHTPNILQALIGTGYWTDFFTATIPPSFYSIWVLISVGLVSSALVYLLARPARPWVILWVGILIASIIFETGSNSPFGRLVEWIFVNFPLMALFKSPQHLIFPTTLALTVILGLFSAKILERRSWRLQIGILLVLLLAVSIWVSPFFSGNLGGNVDVYQLPTSYANINSIISHDSEAGFRVLYLPMSGSPHYLNDSFQRENQGGDPTITFSKAPTIVSDLVTNPQAKDFAITMEEMLGMPNPPPNTAKLLSLVNVKYVVLRNDVLPNFGPLVGHWNVTQVYANLMHLNGIRLITTYTEASLWVNELPKAPLIYAASDAIYDNIPISSIRNWQILSGRWTAFQQYSVIGTDGMLRTEPVFVDSELTVHTQLLSTSRSFDDWVLWRGSDSNNYYYAGQTGVGYFTVGRVVEGQRTEMFSRWMGYSTNQTLWIRIISQGSTFTVFSSPDAHAWISMYAFEDATFPTGFVAFKSDGVSRLSNVTISDSSNNVIFIDDFSRSNLVQLILSNRFVVGQTVVVSPSAGLPAQLYPNATAQVTSGDDTQKQIQIDSKGLFYLVDTESFDAGWSLDAPGATHLIANGWMNSWIMGAEGPLKVSLFYSPQHLFQYGILISVLALTTLSIYLLGLGRVLRKAKRCSLFSRRASFDA